MPISDEIAEKAINFIRDNAKEYGEARGMVEYLKEARKSIKAACMIDAEKAGATTIGAQEKEAYVDPRYDIHLQAIKEAIGKAERLRLQVKAAELRFEKWRTESVNRRKEKNEYGI